jgi:hypothetical protein
LANNIDLEGVMKVARLRRVASLKEKIAFLRCAMKTQRKSNSGVVKISPKGRVADEVNGTLD